MKSIPERFIDISVITRVDKTITSNKYLGIADKI